VSYAHQYIDSMPCKLPWWCAIRYFTSLSQFGFRYEEYLDSQITGTDMYYLEDIELARHLVELG